MSRSVIKRTLSIAVLLATLAFFIYYWRSHPEIAEQLRTISPVAVVTVMGLYLVMTLLLVLIYDAILRLCHKPIPLGEHALLTFYSSIINFFGPLQSGPGFRTVYLKQKHGVPIKAYLTGTLIYYGLFGVINLAFLIIGVLHPVFIPLLIAAIVGVVLVLRQASGKLHWLRRFHQNLHSPILHRLALLTFLQAALVVLVYAVELSAVGQAASLQQVIAYAGAGSLALFVSLTPAAIGFRESFQYFSQSIHGVSDTAIVAANVLDRSAYVTFLIVSFVLIASLHAKHRLSITKPTDNADKPAPPQ